jgi:predicted enzyme related to lactoylglutathione lyase
VDAIRERQEGRRGMGNPIVHFEIIGNDGAKLQQFYRQLFNWEVKADNPWNYGMVEATDSGIGGGIGPGQTTGVTFYIEVPDLEAALARAEELGGKTETPPTEIPDMVTYATFTDPEGNRIGLVKA